MKQWLSGISTGVDMATYVGFYKVPYELRGQRGQGATGGGIALPLLKDSRESCTVRVRLGMVRKFEDLGVGVRGHIGVKKESTKARMLWGII